MSVLHWQAYLYVLGLHSVIGRVNTYKVVNLE